jgi:hypothetical protein
MKTNHGAVINTRMRENYSNIKNKMTAEEKAWAEKFERLEYAIERGFGREAVRTAKELNPNVSKEALLRIKEDIETKERCNPIKAESKKEQDRKRGKSTGVRAPKDNMYDAYDWHRTGGTLIDDDGQEVELGITNHPEDALIAALDAAAVHGISLDTFVNDPKYHTPERKAGRPKKKVEE